jgi:hypothetical protein
MVRSRVTAQPYEDGTEEEAASDRRGRTAHDGTGGNAGVRGNHASGQPR